MEKALSSESQVQTYQTTLRHISEQTYLQGIYFSERVGWNPR